MRCVTSETSGSESQTILSLANPSGTRSTQLTQTKNNQPNQGVQRRRALRSHTRGRPVGGRALTPQPARRFHGIKHCPSTQPIHTHTHTHTHTPLPPKHEPRGGKPLGRWVPPRRGRGMGTFANGFCCRVKSAFSFPINRKKTIISHAKACPLDVSVCVPSAFSYLQWTTSLLHPTLFAQVHLPSFSLLFPWLVPPTRKIDLFPVDAPGVCVSTSFLPSFPPAPPPFIVWAQ
jgi:hypothetical protein